MAVKPRDRSQEEFATSVNALGDIDKLFQTLQPLNSQEPIMNTPVHTPPASPASFTPAPQAQAITGDVPALLAQLLDEVNQQRQVVGAAAGQAVGAAQAAVEAVDKLRADHEQFRADATTAANARDAEIDKLNEQLKAFKTKADVKPTLMDKVINYGTKAGSLAGLLVGGIMVTKYAKERFGEEPAL